MKPLNPYEHHLQRELSELCLSLAPTRSRRAHRVVILLVVYLRYVILQVCADGGGQVPLPAFFETCGHNRGVLNSLLMSAWQPMYRGHTCWDVIIARNTYRGVFTSHQGR